MLKCTDCRSRLDLQGEVHTMNSVLVVFAFHQAGELPQEVTFSCAVMRTSTITPALAVDSFAERGPCAAAAIESQSSRAKLLWWTAQVAHACSLLCMTGSSRGCGGSLSALCTVNASLPGLLMQESPLAACLHRLCRTVALQAGVSLPLGMCQAARAFGVCDASSRCIVAQRLRQQVAALFACVASI
jgi:hypothetical protein